MENQIQLVDREPVSPRRQKWLTIDRNFVAEMLDLDSVQRKDLSWTRHSFEEIVEMSQRSLQIKDDVITIQSYFYPSAKLKLASQLEKVKTRLIKMCPYLQDILSFSPGKLIVAGGSIYSAVWGLKSPDVDFFLINVKNHESLIRDICEMLIRKCKEDQTPYVISRNQNVTTFYCDVEPSPGEELDERYWKNLITNGFKFQFIHRVYPTPMHVLGGFDLPSAYYDGRNIYTNSLGLVCISQQLIFLDPSRRSTSYSSRLRKYAGRGARIILTNIGEKEAVAKFHEIRLWTENDVKIKFCADLKIHLIKGVKGTEHFYLPRRTWNSNVGDYDSQEVNGNWKTANAFLALKGKIDQICWFGTKIEDVFDKPQIEYMLPHEFWKRAQEPREGEPPHSGVMPVSLLKKWTDIKCDGSRMYVPQSVFSEMFAKLESKVRTGIHSLRNLIDSKGNKPKVEYILENPGRQWTSSINPIVENVREYYNPMMQNFLKIGICDETFLDFRCAWQKGQSAFAGLLFPKVVLGMILTYMRRARAQHAFEELLK